MTETQPLPIEVESFGDSAVMVTIRDDDARARRREIIAFRERLLARRPFGVTDVVSGLESLLVEFDPLITAPGHVDYAARLLAELASRQADAEHGPVNAFTIPVVFDDTTGPDLGSVAEELGITVDEVVDAITSSTFTIALLGAAMAPMMDGLNTPRPVRRRAEPRTNVAPGSIMIAGTNAIIQPFAGPTGWRVVGHTPHKIVDITRDVPIGYATGDVVRFERISRENARVLDGSFLAPDTVSS